ncbi:tryptophan synthase beta subunit-like PLP-dependent enzyme [Aspergillus affinis]|uniref:tryptophan synthase beta subunit-like PLP-dependent enzyme n=1 Tax=Aspergillus affinis TaxID=1070780 RepID=UPI0022FEBFF0|nr:tryptophan synthase beta subunit-like PLP-dependent enzyme [Aspergillus affinis]KAI9036939.1 tryptophan synthase beta subunit-like PLP-dependent enzyme [Aspergillus affinis]
MAKTIHTLTPSAIATAHALIKPYIHTTPLLTNTTLNNLASTPQSADSLHGTEWEGQTPSNPTIRFFFKCENYQRIGAFKARGAFHALLRLIEEEGEEVVRGRGVITHSSGNHAQALALAAQTLHIPAYVVMPRISTVSKISGTKGYGAEVIFSGSTSTEREAVVAEVQAKTNAFLIPPYDHFDIICGQGTTGLEMQGQYAALVAEKPGLSVHGPRAEGQLDAVITPVGGGGLNAGVATFFSDESTKVFGAEPSFEGGDDCRRGLLAGERVQAVKTLTIADGLRTPVGVLNWEVISDGNKVAGVFAVTEAQIKATMRLVLERMKVVVEPSAVVGLAVCLFNEDFRRMVEKEAPDGWDIGVVFSGGNTTVEAIGKLFA